MERVNKKVNEKDFMCSILTPAGSTGETPPVSTPESSLLTSTGSTLTFLRSIVTPLRSFTTFLRNFTTPVRNFTTPVRSFVTPAKAGVQRFLKKVKKGGGLLAPDTEEVVAGLWKDEEVFLTAARELRARGYRHLHAITPFPVHGLEGILGIRRSWIPYVTFVFGLGGCGLGVWFTWWTSAVSWPLIVGGKPFWSLPAFVPVIFECTILFGALASVAALFYACGLPSIDPPVLHKDLSSHQFALYIKLKDKKNLHRGVKTNF